MEQHIKAWKSHERRYTLTSNTFTKSELPQEDLQWSIVRQERIQPRWSQERLQNEAKSIQFIASNTTIPVPEFLDLHEDEDGLFHLRTRRARGIPLDELDPLHAPAAVKKVNECLEQQILPQLRRLRSCTIGSVDVGLPLVPPSRITGRDRRTHWQRASRPNPDFQLIHGDLAQQNIFVNPATFEITDISDWEHAGFFPAEFELPLWLRRWDHGENWDEQTDRLIHFLDHPGTFRLMFVNGSFINRKI